MSFHVAGYDKETERLSVSHPLPHALAEMARDLAKMGRDDDGGGIYPLEPHAAIALGARMDKVFNPELYDWFLEPDD